MRVRLIFPNTSLLWAFARILSADHIQIDSTLNTLTCNCSELQVAKAVLQYSATIDSDIEHRNLPGIQKPDI